MQEQVQLPEPDASLFEGLEEVTLEPFEERSPDELQIVGESLGLRMVRIALGERGVCETGRNGGVPLERYVKTFWPNSGPQPWCAFFVSWCYLRSTGRSPQWENKGWVESVHAWARKAGALHSEPQQGDMFGIGGEHMGLVRGVNPDRTFVTIEGNTSSGCVRGFVRPKASVWFATPR